AGIELEPRPEQPTRRAYECLVRCFEQGLLIRTTGDIIALSPPLMLQKSHIDQIVDTLGQVLATLP
ncbi:MAG: aspartate aminotransferase family protein, partial [Leptolyngbyaceae cyanobacterium]